MSMNEYDRQTIKYLRATGTSETLIARVERAIEWASRAEAELRDLQQQLAAAQAQTKLLAAELIERAAPR